MTVPKRPRVLIAEDHVAVATAVCRVLSLTCEVVGTVADGNAVLEAAQRLEPDMIVADLNLPNASGLQVCRQIHRWNRGVQVIVFTAMNDPDIRQRCLDEGAAAFVSKMGGSDDADLLSTIQRLWAARP